MQSLSYAQACSRCRWLRLFAVLRCDQLYHNRMSNALLSLPGVAGEDFGVRSLDAGLARHACKALANGGANVLDAFSCRFARTPSTSAFQPYG